MKVPLSLSVYEHAAQFRGKTPWEVSRDGETDRHLFLEKMDTYPDVRVRVLMKHPQRIPCS